MPWLEKLDNDGTPTGEKKFFGDAQATQILSFRHPRWRTAAPDKVKAHRDRPSIVEEEGKITEFNPLPLRVSQVKDAVKNIDDIEVLEDALRREENSSIVRKTVAEAIDKRIEELKQDNNE